MTIAWTGFPAAQDAVDGDILVGLLGGTTNQRFNASSWLLTASNLSDVASAVTAFNNISPLTTKGDLLTNDGTNGIRLAIGTAGQILSISAGLPAWENNPSLLITNNLSDVANAATSAHNLGLGTADSPTFAALTITGAATAASFVSTGLNVLSNVNALTAHSGGGQGSALALTQAINRVTTVAAGGDSVKLPASLAGNMIVVTNSAASNAMDCFPASGEVINALSANTALSIVANSTVIFFCAVAGIWNSVVTA